jgi:hypothetical protein
MRGMTRSETMTSALKAVSRFLPVGRNLRVKVAIGKHGSHGGALTLVVVNDQDPARNRRQSGHRLSF